MEKIVQNIEYDYLGRMKLIKNLTERYPFLKKSVIGKSCVGRDITALKLGSDNEYCLISAAFHGSEHITSVILLMFIENLCKAINENGVVSGIKARAALRGRGIIFVPCVNPDGCEISINGANALSSNDKHILKLSKGDFAHWNSNFRGVDINHNFPAGWVDLKSREISDGIYCPGPTRFGGIKPESEPETIAIMDVCRNNKIRHATALHSQGEVIYWSYGHTKPPRSKKMAEIMATSSGYALDTPVGLAVGGGFKDWFIEEFNRPAFTVELGLGKNPLPPNEAETIYKRVEEMFMLLTVM